MIALAGVLFDAPVMGALRLHPERDAEEARGEQGGEDAVRAAALNVAIRLAMPLDDRHGMTSWYVLLWNVIAPP
jgi:hypothetical protein